MAIFLLTLLIGNRCIPRDKAVTREMIGHDFLAFYTAGSFVRQGRYHELYNLDSVRDFEQATAHAVGLEVGKSFGPWWNPPFYALPFAPLSQLPYPSALIAWRWINLAALAGALTLLARMMAQATAAGPKVWGLIPLLVLVSMPFVQALSHGQNTFTSLLLLSAMVACWRAERGIWAGLIGGLLFYKPQLAAVVAAALVWDLGVPALLGLAATGVALLIVTQLWLPGSLTDFVHQLPANVRWMQVEHAYLWERHVTLKAFWRLLLQGREAGDARWLTTILTDLSIAAVVAILARAAIRTCARRQPFPLLRYRGGGFAQGHTNGQQTSQPQNQIGRLRRDRWVAATITAMPLLMPFYFDYDLLLLAIPATLYGAERIAHPNLYRPADSWLTRAWVALFFWLFVNPAVGLHTHVDVTVVLLSTVAGLSAMRAMRSDLAATTGAADTAALPHPQRRAA